MLWFVLFTSRLSDYPKCTLQGPNEICIYRDILEDIGYTYSLIIELKALKGIVYQMIEGGIDDTNYYALS